MVIRDVKRGIAILLSVAVLSFGVTGCGGGGGGGTDTTPTNTQTQDDTSSTETPNGTTTSESYLLPNNNVKGKSILANANVNIFKINADRTFSKLFNEKSDSTGIFDTHSNELLDGDQDFYLYQITGGQYLDGTLNNSTHRLIVWGDEVKNRIYEQPLFVTPISEYLYISVMEWIEQHPVDDYHANFLLDIDYRQELFLREIFGSRADLYELGYFDPETKMDWYENTLPILYAQVESDLRNGHDDYAHRPQSLYKYWGVKDRVDHGRPYDLTMSLDETKIFWLENNTYVGTDIEGKLASQGYNGFTVLDISDKSTITIHNEYSIQNPLHLQVSDDQKLAYVIHDDVDYVQTELHKLTLKIINIENLQQPYEVSSLLIKEFLNENRVQKESITDMLLANKKNKLYLPYIDHLEGSIIEVDVSDPTKPVIGEQVTLSVPFRHTKISQDESMIYATDALGEHGFYIYDTVSKLISGELNMYYADTFVVSKDETTAFISQSIGTLHIVDIQDPTNPKVISNTATSGATLLLSADETKLYSNSSKDFSPATLSILNIRDLKNPELIHHSDDVYVTDEGSPHQGTALLTADGNTGYFADVGQHVISSTENINGTIKLHTVDLSTHIDPIP